MSAIHRPSRLTWTFTAILATLLIAVWLCWPERAGQVSSQQQSGPPGTRPDAAVPAASALVPSPALPAPPPVSTHLLPPPTGKLWVFGGATAGEPDGLTAPKAATSRGRNVLPAGRRYQIDRFPNLRTLREGEKVEVGLPDGRVFAGNVNWSKRDEVYEDTHQVSIGFGGNMGGIVAIHDRTTGRIQGQILVEYDKQAWTLSTADDGTLWLEENLREDLVCELQGALAARSSELPGDPWVAGNGMAAPILNSRPSATAVLYIDFDGEPTQVYPDWPLLNPALPIAVTHSGLTADQMTLVWRRVAEDYIQFHVNVTTDPNNYSAAPVGSRMRILVGGTLTTVHIGGEYQGVGGPGVARLRSFQPNAVSGKSYSSTVPCWLEVSAYGNNPSLMAGEVLSSIASNISHEFGHTLSLWHDGNDGSQPTDVLPGDYYPGHGTAPFDWGSIMGSPYRPLSANAKGIVQWAKNDYPGANNSQNDLAIIAGADNGFGYVADESTSLVAALDLTATGLDPNQVGGGGIIANNSDKDWWKLVIPVATEVTVTVEPADQAVSLPNLDCGFRIEDAAGTTLAGPFSAENDLTAVATTTLSPGTYYIVAFGTGNRQFADSTGYNDYGSTGRYLITADMVPLTVAGSLDPSFESIEANSSIFSLALQPDGKVLVGGAFTTYDGLLAKNIVRLNADGSLDDTFEANIGTADFAGHNLTVQPDGKLLSSGGYRLPEQVGLAHAHAGVVRLNADGSFDSDLGRVRCMWWDGTYQEQTTEQLTSTISHIELQPDGKMLAGGNFTHYNDTEQYGLVRLLPNGSRDSSFTPLTTDPGPRRNAHDVRGTAVQPDGEVILLGSFRLGGQYLKFARLHTNGSLDSSFSPIQGSLTSQPYGSLVLQPDGKVFAYGKRFHPNGNLDASFSPSGVAGILALQADGKVFAYGNAGIVRLHSDGAFDPTFSSIPLFGGCTLQGDGKVLSMHQGNRWVRLLNDPAILRLEATSPDRVEWQRGGTAPEVAHVTFERSPDGVAWTSLGTGTRIAGGWELTGVNLVGSGHLRARGRPSGFGNGSIYEQTAIYGVAEIAVTGNGANISSGDITPQPLDHTDFGSAVVEGSSVTRTFTITNWGGTSLNLSGDPLVELSGPHAADFTLIEQPANTLAAGGTTTFSVRFAPYAEGIRLAQVSIANDDSNENPFEFSIQGHGLVPPDLSAPTVVISSPSTDGTSVTSASLPLAGTAGDDYGVSSVWLRVNGSPWLIASGTAEWSTSVTLAPGNNTIEAQSRDRAANSSAIAVRTVQYEAFEPDLTAPTVAISIPSADGNSVTFADFAVAGTANDNEGVTAVWVRVNGGAWTPATGTTDWTAMVTLAVGDNLVEVRSQDPSDNYSTIAARTAIYTGRPEINLQLDNGSTFSNGEEFFFGAVETGQTTDQTFRILNSGDIALNLEGSPRIALGGFHAADFTVTAQPAPAVAPGGIATFSVRFTPSAVGSRNATLSIASDDSDENPFVISIEGFATAPPDIIAPTVAINTPPANGTTVALAGFAVVGTAGDNVGVTSVEVRVNGGAWIVATGTTNWSAPVTLVIGSNTIEARSQDISDNFSASAAREIIYEVAHEIELRLVDGPLLPNGHGVHFGDRETGSWVDQQFAILNKGGSDLTGLVLNLEGQDANQFHIADGVGAPPGPTLAAGETAYFAIRFAPDSPSLKFARLTITSDDAVENPTILYLSGNALTGEIAVFQGGYGSVDELPNGAVIGFGEWQPSSSASRMFTIANESEASLAIGTPSVSGVHAADFELHVEDVPEVLGPGEFVQFGVTFVPGGQGPRTAVLHLSSDDADEEDFEIGLSAGGMIIPPPYVQETYLKAGDAGLRFFGAAVAVGGNTVVVGQPGDSLLLDPSGGAAYVYEKGVSGWTQAARLNGEAPVPGMLFGNTVAISGDTILVGDPGANAAMGAVHVFVRLGGGWVRQAILMASNAEVGDGFGERVALSGNTAVVLAAHEASQASGVNGNQADNSAPGSGAAYVFVRSSGSWSQQAYLKSVPGKTISSVAVDGDTIATGGPADDEGAGGVCVFQRSADSWQHHGYLKGSNTDEGNNFGGTVSLSGDTLAVGAIGERGVSTGVNGDEVQPAGAVESGAAYVFARTGTTWEQEAYIKASISYIEGWGFGMVSLSGDTLVVGSQWESGNGLGTTAMPGEDGRAVESGAVYVFSRSGGTWSQTAYLKASNADGGDTFGSAVAVAGSLIAVGTTHEASDATGINANQANNRSIFAGAAYVFGETKVSDGFGNWAAFEGLHGDDAEPSATPFGDGVPNLLKFAFDMDGRGPDVSRLEPGAGSSGLPFVGLAGEGAASMLRVEFVRRKNSGLIYTPKRSNTLQIGSFSPMIGTPVVTPIPFTDDQWERVVVEESIDLSVTPRAFVTVEVNEP